VGEAVRLLVLSSFPPQMVAADSGACPSNMPLLSNSTVQPLSWELAHESKVAGTYVGGVLIGRPFLRNVGFDTLHQYGRRVAPRPVSLADTCPVIEFRHRSNTEGFGSLIPPYVVTVRMEVTKFGPREQVQAHVIVNNNVLDSLAS
jgi:hypothetical protein